MYNNDELINAKQRMRDLRAANELINKIAKDYPTISPITADDYPLFQKFFSKEPHTYGNSWTYITQGMYGIGPNKIGYKYYDGTNLSAVCVYPKNENPKTLVFYWVRPMGKTILKEIHTLSKKFLKNYKLPTYAKKLFKNQHDQLIQMGFKEVGTFPWHSLYPAEDDTYPEQILDISATLSASRSGGKDRRLSRSYRYYELFKTEHAGSSDSTLDHQKEALQLVDDFFVYKNSHSKLPVISEPSDYHAMILGKSLNNSTVEKFYFYKNAPIGFFYSEVQGKGYASQYALISLRQRSNHIVDYMMFDLLDSLSSRGIKYVNLGGSENKDLDYFKRKFEPVSKNQMYWVALY